MKPRFIDMLSDRIMSWTGSNSSLFLHTLFFIFAFATHWLFGWTFEFILLVLTTLVSLEAIYLALFIQRAVNQQGARLEDVEETLDEVEDSIDEVEKNLDDVEESQTELEEDIADIATDTAKHLEEPMDEVVAELKKLLKELKAQTNKTKK